MQFMQASFAVMDAERRVTAAREAVKVIDQQSGTAPAAEATLDQMTRDHTILKENYDQLVRRRESARMTQAADLSSGAEQFRIIQAPSIAERAVVPGSQDVASWWALSLRSRQGPRWPMRLGMLRGTFVTAAEAELALGLPVIARLRTGKAFVASVRLRRCAHAAGRHARHFRRGIRSFFRRPSLLAPVRTEIYRFIETNISPLDRAICFSVGEHGQCLCSQVLDQATAKKLLSPHWAGARNAPTTSFV